MDRSDVLGLLLPALEKVGDRIIGFDDKIRRKFDRALETALKSNSELYIKEAKVHMAELVGLILLVMDEPSSINTIPLPNYIDREEFRSFYNQTEREEELQDYLAKKLQHFQNKGILKEVKTNGHKVDQLIESNEEIRGGIEEIKERLRGNVEASDAGSFDDLYKCLDKKLNNKREHHPSFQLMEIDNRLFPNATPKKKPIKLEALDSNDQLKTVSEIIAESWRKKETNHLMIEGEGGIGKTVTLLSIPDTDKFAHHYVPAIYIPLHELPEGDNPIERYIKNKILKNKEKLYDDLLELIDGPWDNGPKLLLLLDGFNEISAEHKVTISKDIKYWSEYEGVQVITSSRYDIHSYVALGKNCSAIKLQPLSEMTVEEYLKSKDICPPTVDAVKKLITTPLLLTLYAMTERVMEERESDSSDFKEVRNAGSLVWNYLQCELWNFGKENEDAKNAIIAMEFIAPYIAWRMQQNTLFVLNKKEFHDFLDEAYKELECHFNNSATFPFHIQDALQKANGIPPVDLIRNLLENQLCLFIKSGNYYRLMHQRFRDALAALHLINSSYLSGESLPEEWKTSVDHYVMGFVADLVSEDEDEAKRLWEQNRKTQPSIENATRNQLRLQGLLHNNDFSHLDFSGLDLSNISLYPYRTSVAQLKMPTLAKQFEGTAISKKTFSAESHSDTVTSVAVSPDGRRVVSGSKDNTIRIWDMDSGECLKTLEGHHGDVTAVAVSPDGRRIVSGSADRTIRIWNMDSGECLKTSEGHHRGVTAVAVYSDGRHIVSGSFDCTIRIWDMDNGDCLKTLEGHQKWVTSVAVSPDGRRIVSGSYDRTIRIWDMDSWDCLKTLEGHQGGVEDVVVFIDGGRIVSGSGDRTIRIWDMDNGECLKTLEGHHEDVTTVAVSIDGRCIVSGSRDRTIRIWDMDSGECLKTLERHQDWVNAITVSIDGRRIVSGSDDHTIRIWDIDSGDSLKTLEGYQGGVKTVAMSKDGRCIVSGSWDRTIRIWGMDSGDCFKTLEGHTNGVRVVAVSKDGRLIVSGSVDHTIRIWDMDSAECLKTLEGHKYIVNDVAVSIDGRRIVSGSGDGSICIWDMDSGACLKTLEGHQDWVRAVTVSKDGRHVVSGSDDRTIRIWDMDSGDCLKTLEGHRDWVTAVAVSIDGRRIVSGSNDRTIRIWDMDSGDCLKTLEGHYRGVTAVAVFPDGRCVVSGSRDCTIRIWDMDSRDCLKTLRGHKHWVNAVAIFPDGRRIVSGSYDSTIRIWDIGTGENIHTINALPLSLVGLDFSKAVIPDEETKELFRQNGAKV